MSFIARGAQRTMASISPQDFGFAVAVFGVMTLCKRSISGISAIPLLAILFGLIMMVIFTRET